MEMDVGCGGRDAVVALENMVCDESRGVHSYKNAQKTKQNKKLSNPKLRSKKASETREEERWFCHPYRTVEVFFFLPSLGEMQLCISVLCDEV